MQSTKVIFTGGNYWMVTALPEVTNDFKVIGGFRWIKSKKEFSNRWKLFPCPKHYQVLNEQEIKDLGAI